MGERKTVLLVARDAAPSHAFDGYFRDALEQAGFIVSTIIEHGHASDVTLADIRREVNQADFVLIGMSSSEERAATEATAARYALENGTSYGFYGDCFNCHRRPWFEPYRDKAALYLGVNDVDAENARHTFPNGITYGWCNPLREAWREPIRDREEARAILGVAETDKQVVLVSGGKFTAANMLILQALAEADTTPDNTVVVFAPHPGEFRGQPNTLEAMAGKVVLEKVYQEVFRHSATKMYFLSNEFDIPSETALTGADVVVGFSGSPELRAAYLGIPVVVCDATTSRNRHQEANGDPRPEIELMQYARIAKPYELASSVANLLTGEMSPPTTDVTNVKCGLAKKTVIAAIKYILR